MKTNFFQDLFGSLPAFFKPDTDSFSLPAVEHSVAENDMPTGVSRYLSSRPVATGVDKYLKNHRQHEVTGVDKYVARRILADPDRPSATSVTKYLQEKREKTKPSSTSGVAKYVSKQVLRSTDRTVPTGVEQYVAKRLKAEKEKIAGNTGVDKFLLAKERAARKAAAEKLVAYYIEKEEAERVAAAAQMPENDIEPSNEVEAMSADATGVDKYLVLRKNSQASGKATGVAKYVAKKIAWANNQPAKTGVSKYLQKQSLQIKPPSTSVSRYLLKQKYAPKSVIETTGVDKYLERKETLSSVAGKYSGVAKYIAKMAVLKKTPKSVEAVITNEKTQLSTEEAEASIAGPTRVAKYLQLREDERQARFAVDESVVSETAETDIDASSADIDDAVATGVEKYLRKKRHDNIPVSSATVTGVERYLRNKR